MKQNLKQKLPNSLNHISCLLASSALANSSSSSSPPKFCCCCCYAFVSCILYKIALSISASPPVPIFGGIGFARTFLSIARAISSSFSLKPRACPAFYWDAVGFPLRLLFLCSPPNGYMSPAPGKASRLPMLLPKVLSPPTSLSTVYGIASDKSLTFTLPPPRAAPRSLPAPIAPALFILPAPDAPP